MSRVLLNDVYADRRDQIADLRDSYNIVHVTIEDGKFVAYCA